MEKAWPAGVGVSVIIVNWNTGKLLAACLRSLLKLPEHQSISDIIVVDNASTDDSFTRAQAAITSHTPRIRYVPLAANRGFAAANNHALTLVNPSHHVLLLNPDTIISPGALSSLLVALEHHPQAGIFGPTLHHPDGSRQPSVRRFPTLVIFVVWFLKLSRVITHTRLWQHYLAADFNYSREQAVDQVMGAAFLIRQELIFSVVHRTAGQALRQVGFLDEKFWVWFEEVDYCRRAHTTGWQVMYIPTPPITHVGAASFNQLLGLQRTLPFLRSALHYSAKHLGATATMVLWLLFPIAVTLSLPASLVHATVKYKNQKNLA